MSEKSDFLLSSTDSDPFLDSGSDYRPDNEQNSSKDDSSSAASVVSENESQNNDNGNDENRVQGRKRKKNKNEWKRIVNAAKRYHGKAYVNRSGRNMPEIKFKNTDCKCSRRCSDSVKAEERRIIFNSFYELGDRVKQNIYLRGLIQNTVIKQRRARDSSRTPKSKTLRYFLTTTDLSIRVCKKFFVDTFQVSDARLYKISSSSAASSCIDRRGRKTPSNKIDITKVKEHIRSFPSYKSHYTRSDTPNRRYLRSDLTIRKMYTLYLEKCEQESLEPVKEKMYYHVFSTQFNLHFKPPSKDTCHLCDSLQNILTFSQNEEEKRKAKIDKDLHLCKAEYARNSLNRDKSLANEEIYVFTFDLEKALPFPKMTTSVAYYKVNMYMYNLGIHSFNDNTGYMFMWDETEGSRGSQEIAACLVKHLKKHASGHAHIVMYSDCCIGQTEQKQFFVTEKLTRMDIKSTG